MRRTLKALVVAVGIAVAAVFATPERTQASVACTVTLSEEGLTLCNINGEPGTCRVVVADLYVYHLRFSLADITLWWDDVYMGGEWIGVPGGGWRQTEWIEIPYSQIDISATLDVVTDLDETCTDTKTLTFW